MKTEIKILAIETASEACSASLLVNDAVNAKSKNQKIYSQIEVTPRQHAKQILSMLDKVLDEGETELKDIDAIAFGRGPGAFTGLRIATGVAQGIALSVDKPVVPVSTLAALALLAINELEVNGKQYKGETIATALDARMGEVYWGLFILNNDEIKLQGKEQVSKPQEMLQSLLKTTAEMDENSIYTIGAGWDVYEKELFKESKPNQIIHLKGLYPMAKEISKLALTLFKKGKSVAPENAQPVYIRNNVAKKSIKQ